MMNMMNNAKALIALLVAILLAMVLLGVIQVVKVKAHQAASGWSYPSNCCGNKDCLQLRSDEITPAKNGYMIKMLFREQGGSVTYYIQEFVNKEKAAWSGDGENHICINPSALAGQQVRCLFIGGVM